MPPRAPATCCSTAESTALHEQQFLCTREEPQWLAPAYQWALILDSLRTHERDHPGVGPHPSTTQWAAEYGRTIPGSSCAEQVATMQRWDDRARRDDQARIIAYGTSTPSSIERALGARASDPDWGQRLAAALEDFSDCPWALDLFRPSTEEPLR